ncbi:hypothetical protein ACFL6K_02205, partial [Candidatus Latescibacterota bacterium]
VSILRRPGNPESFPDLTGENNIPQHEFSEPETLRMPESWALFPDPEPEPTETIPIDKVPDKRREFKTDLLGIPLGGIPAIPIHIVRNTPNFIKWKIKDIFRKRRIKQMAEDNFVAISEKDVRLMILVWRDGLLNTRKLSKSDRVFISAAQSDDSETMTHEAYLQEMEKRGLVTSLMFEDNLVFRANFSRNEIMNAFISESENTSFRTFIELIVAHADSTKTEITIPPSRQ